MNKFIYTELKNITEKEFFKRELGFQVLSITDFDEIRLDETIVIASNNPEFWKPFLESRRESSCIFILIGNETYEPRLFNALNHINAVRHVYLYNAPTQIKGVTIIKTFIGNLLDVIGYNEPSTESSYRDLRNSYYLKKKFRDISITYPYSRLPQGYSNNFASKLETKLKLSSSESLISERVLSFAKPLEDRTKFISFSGQPTNRKRQMMLFWARKYMNEAPDVTEGFRGLGMEGGFIYLDQLMESKFTLVPPGSFNNSNHRYTESLICGSIPLILPKNSIDPSENCNWTNSVRGVQAYSAKFLLRYANRIGDVDLNDLLKQTREQDFNEIRRFSRSFLEMVSLP
jgi:hypothetical protein